MQKTTSLLCLLILMLTFQTKGQTHKHVHNHNYKQMHKIKHVHTTHEPSHNTFIEEIETGGETSTSNNFSTSENYKDQMSKKTKIKHFKIPSNEDKNSHISKNNNYKMPYSTRKKNTSPRIDSVLIATKLSD